MDYSALIADYAKNYQETRSDRSEKKRYEYKVSVRKMNETAVSRRYGISVEEYRRMKARCECKCEICGKVLEDTDTYTRICIDHNHRTGKVRGLLCQSCNNRVGWAERYFNVPEKAQRYAAERNYLRARDEDYA